MHIDKEFQSLIPPLTAEEYAGLEESILSEGCRDALVVWGDTLIDGHNRYEICTKHGIPFDTVEMDFPDRDAVMLWMMKNQLARRNLNTIQYIDIVSKCAESIQKKARERQATSTGGKNPQLMEIFPEAENKTSRDELGAMAGVSGKTYEHGVAVLEKAPKPVVDAVKSDDLSINAAYQVTKMEPEQQEEVAERIEQGEKPKEVVADVQKRPHVTLERLARNAGRAGKHAIAIIGEHNVTDPSEDVFLKDLLVREVFTTEQMQWRPPKRKLYAKEAADVYIRYFYKVA